NALPLDRLDQRGRDATSLGERVERQEVAVVRPLAAFGGDGRGEVGVGHAELSAHDPADRGERQPLLLEGADLADPVRVLGPVPRDASLAFGRRKQPERLVVADGVHRHTGPRRELFDAIPHDSSLYECALEGSTSRSLRRPDYDAAPW